MRAKDTLRGKQTHILAAQSSYQTSGCCKLFDGSEKEGGPLWGWKLLVYRCLCHHQLDDLSFLRALDTKSERASAGMCLGNSKFPSPKEGVGR